MLRIHHPKLLLAVILLIAFGSAAAATLADDRGADPDGGIVTQLPLDPVPTVSPDEAAKAESIVREAGLVTEIARGQDWTAANFAFRTVAGYGKAIAFTATWPEPVEARSRWLLLRCQDTRRFEPELTWTQVTTLGIVVDPASGTLIELGVRDPLGPEAAQGALAPRQARVTSDENAVLRDLATGKALADGAVDSVLAKAGQCPPGHIDNN